VVSTRTGVRAPNRVRSAAISAIRSVSDASATTASAAMPSGEAR